MNNIRTNLILDMQNEHNNDPYADLILLTFC